VRELPRKNNGLGDLDRICEEVRLTRRSVTAMLVAAAGALTQARAQTRVSPTTPVTPAPRTVVTPDIVVAGLQPAYYEVRRPDDFLVLNYKLHNLRIVGAAPSQQIARINAQQPGWIVVEHQSQAIAEQAYWSKPSADGPPVPGSAQSRISGPSRIVFQMPSGLSQANWGLPGLLEACATWPMRLDALARPAPSNFSRIISPYRALTISAQRLDEASQVILASLPNDLRNEIGALIPAAATRISDTIEAAAARGEEFSDDDIDSFVGAELRNGLGRSATAQSFEHAFLSARALEAAAASRSLRVLVQLSAQNRAQPIERIDGIVAQPNISAALATSTPRPLDDTVTGIEAPYRLVQSPLETAGWAHSLQPVARSGRTEIWHTRLGTRKSGGVADLSPEPLRALWSPDYGAGACAGAIGSGTRWALYGNERRDLVRLTAGFNERTEAGGAYTPMPATASKLILTALGAAFDFDGAWTTRPRASGNLPAVDTEAWTHRAANGRDYFVRIVKAGKLFPFGHAASLVRITERKFETAHGGRLALLRQRAFIIVREPVREYSGARQAYDGRDFPFRSIEIVTRVTPDLDPPGGPACDRVFLDPPAPDNSVSTACNHPKEASDSGFVPTIGMKDFEFRLIGVDRAGRRIPFSAPLILLLDIKNTPAGVTTASQFYENGPPGACASAKKTRNVVKMGGAVIQFAPQASGGNLDGDTNVPAKTVTFRAAPPSSAVAIGEPRFFPAVKQAEVSLPAVKSLLESDAPVVVAFNEKYLQHGLGGANAKGQLFLNIVSAAAGQIGANPSKPSDKFGGMIAPNLTPKALSRNFGLVTGNNFESTFGAGKFDPVDFLPDAKLFGVIDLKTVLKVVVDTATASGAGRTPKFTTVELPDRIEAKYTIEQTGLGNVPPLFESMPGSRLKIDTKAVAKRKPNAAPEPPETKIEGLVEKFQINLFSCLILTFDKISFVAVPGKKPKVDVDLDPQHGVIFGGPLEFINELKDVIPANGFSDPAPIAVTPAGISAGYTLSLPALQVGICSISNISIGAAFNIPFTGGPPSARFNFAERHAPFNITVSMFGGGGFFAAVVDTGGMREIEIQLEFGAKIEINLGVASGGVYVKGGFYFHLKDNAGVQSIYFEGFVELGGHLSIICIITVSLVFHLALAYEKDGAAKKSRLFGQASLTVEVEILFFSTSVSVKVEKQFAGSQADPLFVDFIPNDAVWRQYCEAFA